MLICRTIFPSLARAVKLVTGSLPPAADSRRCRQPGVFDGMGHGLSAGYELMAGMGCRRVCAVCGYGLKAGDRVQPVVDTENIAKGYVPTKMPVY